MAHFFHNITEDPVCIQSMADIKIQQVTSCIFLYPFTNYCIQLDMEVDHGFTGAYVTIFGKIDHLCASNEIHFLPVQERYIHALSGNTNCLTIDGQVCFYRRLFTDAVKPRGCISWSWGALIGLHGVPNCSSR